MPQVSTVRINGHALRELRTQRGLTVSQLAARIGRHEQSVRKLETSGDKLASRVFAHQLANALKTDVGEFVIAADAPEANGAAA